MLSYQALEMNSDEVRSANLQQFSYQKNERMKTILKSHWEALNFDKDFVVSTVSDIDFDWNEEVDHVVKKMHIKRKGGINSKQSMYNSKMFTELALIKMKLHLVSVWRSNKNSLTSS